MVPSPGGWDTLDKAGVRADRGYGGLFLNALESSPPLFTAPPKANSVSSLLQHGHIDSGHVALGFKS